MSKIPTFKASVDKSSVFDVDDKQYKYCRDKSLSTIFISPKTDRLESNTFKSVTTKENIRLNTIIHYFDADKIITTLKKLNELLIN